jgi:YVTN family beta-propeller protein
VTTRSRGAALLLGILLLLAGCHIDDTRAALIQSSSPPPPARGPQAGLSRVVLYLNGPPQSPIEVSFDVTSIAAVRTDGFRAPLSTARTTVNSLEIVERQRLLAEAFIPQGRYTSLALGIERARVRRESRLVDLSLPGQEILVPTDFEMRRGEATPLFLEWDVGRAIENEVFFRAAFIVSGKGQELRRVLAYVTNELSDTMSVVDRQTDRVVSVVEVGRGPRGVAVSDDVTRAYVVNSGASTLSIIDVNTTRVLHTTNLEAGASASDIVVTGDNRRVYVTNTALNSVSVIDTTSFQILATVPVGFRPVSLALAPNRQLLLVANTGANTLSAIDTARNVVVATVQVDFQPSDVTFDPAGTQAFVTHRNSPRLSIVSLGSLRVARTVNAGAATAALPESETSAARVFLTRPQLPRLSLFDVNLNTEVHTIPVGDSPEDLVVDTDREKLYVVNRGSNSITVVDRNALRVRTTIEVGRRPWGIAIVP